MIQPTQTRWSWFIRDSPVSILRIARNTFSVPLDNGTSWTDISGTDGGNPTSNLPDLPLHSVVIDPDTSPHSYMVASDAGVMRSADGGPTWQVLGVGLPTVYCSSLQIDTTATPSLLRVGTYGRSTFELTAATGPLLAVNANLAFGPICVGSSDTRLLQLFNVGSTDLHIASIVRVSGSNDFQLTGPATPVTIQPGEELDFTVTFTPTQTGNQTAIFQINSDDPFQPAFQVSATGSTSPPGEIRVTGSTTFGDVCPGTSAEKTSQSAMLEHAIFTSLVHRWIVRISRWLTTRSRQP